MRQCSFCHPVNLKNLSKILSIATAVPPYKHAQASILEFMQNVYALNEADRRKLRFLYRQSDIEARYSVIPDYSLPAADWQFYPATENLEPFPGIESRMEWFHRSAANLSVKAIHDCLKGHATTHDITHLITVSCTGMSAPGLDLQIMEQLGLPAHIFRTSVNFMGCYAALHAMKIADALCRTSENARVLVVCTELCTLHFQKEPTPDNLASSLLFGDGCAAMLMASATAEGGTSVRSFHSRAGFGGKEDMSWNISSTGFLMSLSNYVPDLIEQDVGSLIAAALADAGLHTEDITHWCIHPGGKRILSATAKSVGLPGEALQYSYDVLRRYGNMSSPTVLFVLKDILAAQGEKRILGAAFGPGLTMETFLLEQNGN